MIPIEDDDPTPATFAYVAVDIGPPGAEIWHAPLRADGMVIAQARIWIEIDATNHARVMFQIGQAAPIVLAEE